MDAIFKNAWVKELSRSGLFASSDPAEWILTESNYSFVLRTINVNVTQVTTALRLELQQRPDHQMPYDDFCQLFKKEFAKAASL